MKIEQYDRVLLKDGRTAIVVEILGGGEAFIIDVDLDKGWETIEVWKDAIEKVITF